MKNDLQTYFLMKGKKFHKVKEEESEGWLAQLVELLPYKQTVTGSSPVPPNLKNSRKKNENKTFFGLIV